MSPAEARRHVDHEATLMGEDNDCAVRALTHATGLPYGSIHRRFEECGRKRSNGTPRQITEDVLDELGYEWHESTELAGTQIKQLQRQAPFSEDSVHLVFVYQHVLCMKGNEVLDWTDGRHHRVVTTYSLKKVRPAAHLSINEDFSLDECLLCEETKEFLRPHTIRDTDRLEIEMDDDGVRFQVRLYQRSGDHSHGPSTRATAWAEATPGAKEVQCPGGRAGVYYAMPSGMYAVLRMITTFGLDKIDFHDDEARLRFEVTRMRFYQGERIARVNYEWQTHGIVPDHDLEMSEDLPLGKYQQVAAYLATVSESFAYFMEQGTGKTAAAVSALMTLAKRANEAGKWFNVLVMCPKQVCYNWKSEIAAFGTQPMKVEILRGLEHKRLEALARCRTPNEDYVGGIGIINYESGMSMGAVLTMMKTGWDLIILDESHSIASPRTKRTKFMLTKMRDVCKRKIILTGTPIANTPLDLWAQFEFMAPAASGFSDFKTFSKFFGKYEKGDHTGGFEKLVGIQHTPLIRENMARSAFVIRKAEAMPDLPEKLYKTEEVEMSKVQADIYQKVATQLAVEIENDLDSDSFGGNRAMLIQNVLTKLLRLAQITAGYVTWDAELNPITGEELAPARIEHFGANPRQDRVIELIKAQPDNEKTIIWSCWIPVIDQLELRLKEEGIKYVRYTGSTSEKDRVQAEWDFNNDPTVKVFIGNQRAGGTGINLLGYNPKAEVLQDTDATQTIYFAMNWSAVTRSQSEDRNHRRGTRKPVQQITMVVPETIDTEIYERVCQKRATALEISDVRAILTSIMGAN